MKVALVHDYLNEYGGAERVLAALSRIWRTAPIYTAFCVPQSTAGQVFAKRRVITSWFSRLPFYQRLYSPLRLVIPWIWGSFDFSGYDLIVTSASWYVTKGLGKKFGVPEVCYCHTPPRWLYGYPTSINFQKYWPVRLYALVVGHFLRLYDYSQAQKVDAFVANSQEVANRIRKFYRREARVIYPPVRLPRVHSGRRRDYFLVLSRLVGAKGVELAVTAAQKGGFKLKIAGEAVGYGGVKNVETLGYVTEAAKVKLMAEAKGFLALEQAADFGITPVEAMLVGTPVIAYKGGGYQETVIDGQTGVLFTDYSPQGLLAAINRFDKLKWDDKVLKRRAALFSEGRFKKHVLDLVKHYSQQARVRPADESF